MDKEIYKNQNATYFKTSTLPLATVLSLNVPLVNIIWEDGGIAAFIFEDSPQLKDYVQKYLNRELQVEPQTYYNQLKLMKSRLHERI